MNFQDAEIVAAAKAAYEQALLNIAEYPDGERAWEAQTCELRNDWIKCVRAALQVLFPRPKKAEPMKR